MFNIYLYMNYIFNYIVKGYKLHLYYKINYIGFFLFGLDFVNKAYTIDITNYIKIRVCVYI